MRRWVPVGTGLMALLGLPKRAINPVPNRHPHRHPRFIHAEKAFFHEKKPLLLRFYFILKIIHFLLKLFYT